MAVEKEYVKKETHIIALNKYSLVNFVKEVNQFVQL